MKTFRDSAESIIGEYLAIEKLSEDDREGLLDKLTTEAMKIIKELVN
jgi:hypothetical protein